MKRAAIAAALAIVLSVAALAVLRSCGGAEPGPPAPGIVRGPYLQQVTPRSVVVRWRTGTETEGLVEYGAEAELLDLKARRDGTGFDHEVELTGLEPGARYHYVVSDGTGRLGSGSGSFRTALEAGSTEPFRVWVVGDSGTGTQYAREVRDAFFGWAGERGADLWVMLGDNAYTHGTDAQYQHGLFDTYPEQLRNLPLYPTLGNHDGRSADSVAGTGPYYEVFTLPTGGEAGGVPSGTEAYYSFDYGNAHFVCLETHSLGLGPGSEMRRWLEADLAATDQLWKIAFFHHPPYTEGSHDSDDESDLIAVRGLLVPVLEEHGVDLVLSGHSHSYERSYLLDGLYAEDDDVTEAKFVDRGDGRPNGDGPYRKPEGAHAGTVYVVAGSAAKLSGGDLDHEAMAVSMNRRGTMALDVSNDRIDAVFVDSDGVVRDHFALVKGSVAVELAERPPG